MSDTVQLILTGHLLPGFSEDTAAENLARLMRLDLARARQLLQNAPTVIKQHLPHKDVESYTAGLNRAGVVVQTRPHAAAPANRSAAPAPQPVTAAAAPQAKPASSPAREGSSIISLVPEQPVAPSLPALAPLIAAAPAVSVRPAAAVTNAPTPFPALEPLLAAEATATVLAPAPLAAPAPAARPALALVDDEPSVANTICCPACGREQAKRTLCLGCGADMPRMIAARETAEQEAKQRAQTPQPTTANPYARNAAASNSTELDDEEAYETPSIFSLSRQGRLGRMRYLAYTMVVVGAAIPALLIVILLLHSVMLTLAVCAVGWWLYVRQTILRLHDLGLSGYWIIGSSFAAGASYQASPTLGTIIAALVTLGSFALCVMPGSKGENDYGLPAEPPTTWVSVLGGIGLVISLISLPFMLKKENLRGRYDRHHQYEQPAGVAGGTGQDDKGESDSDSSSEHGQDSNDKSSN
ncbi:Uncharacterized membrane protein YhaH, DUF805 family [Andreprevotia lacus DSM 23236]|jgi:uncharacterized membrane protein YhaH (DUF805 family)|uniref:Uncharacterized membrane protein YhaH, DUF805 family n=1 Tax=Andreprevotia lacus DSM 23236 TaxID=1121001 RepID=A0A1W1XT73_9NEIS|nr:DUF805 domain-containing protein [Andreprevotia lacus]SMC27087.1 Uncharacterized membrane protein YhaH, DUF805 family [Andreprevotia lacus DSM 23236]